MDTISVANPCNGYRQISWSSHYWYKTLETVASYDVILSHWKLAADLLGKLKSKVSQYFSIATVYAKWLGLE